MLGAVLVVVTLASSCALRHARPAQRPIEPALPLLAPPTLAAAPVLDVPMQQARPQLRRAWGLMRRLQTHIPPSPPPQATITHYSRWAQRSMKPWLKDQMGTLKELRAVLRPFQTRTAGEELFVAAVGAVAFDTVRHQLLSIPPPAEGPGQEGMAATFREQLVASSQPLARRARSDYMTCVGRGSTMPPHLRRWKTLCQQRLAALPEAALKPESKPQPAPKARPLTIHPLTLAPECQGPGPWLLWSGGAPSAPRPDLAQPMEVAVLADIDGIAPGARARLEAAVRSKLKALHPDLAFIPAAEVRRARALVRARRLDQGGLVCEVAPGLERVLARRHPHLAVAEVFHREVVFPLAAGAPSTPEARGDAEPPEGQLTVRFLRPGAPDERSGLPGALEASMPAGRPALRRLLRAAKRLGPPAPARKSSVIGVLAGGLGVAREVYQVVTFARPDPLLDVGGALEAPALRRAVMACVPPGAGVVSLRVELVLGATGAVEGVTVTPVTAPADASQALAGCVQRALRATRWTCPPHLDDTGHARVQATLCASPPASSPGSR